MGVSAMAFPISVIWYRITYLLSPPQGHPVHTIMVPIRPVQASDLPAISALDARLTRTAKPDYWREMLAPDRHFLVAETDKGALAGFIAGEIRAWEFGQPP